MWMYNLDMKISFIAPAYKVDNYLDEFFMSFKNVKNDFEIILVNDEPGKDLSSWLDKYKNLSISIINNEKNIGQGPSRLKGIKSVSNDSTHIMFIDPDDRISESCPTFKDNENIVQFGFNEWYKNKLVSCKPDGGVSKYKLDNHIWGIIFPINIANQISRYSYSGESNDMPIKLRMAEKYVFEKDYSLAIDYRIRKSSTINSKRSERRAKEELATWENLWKIDHLVFEKTSQNNQFFELIINKKSFDKKWYKNKYNELKSRASLSTNFNAHMYRLISYWKTKTIIKSILLNRRLFK